MWAKLTMFWNVYIEYLLLMKIKLFNFYHSYNLNMQVCIETETSSKQDEPSYNAPRRHNKWEWTLI